MRRYVLDFKSFGKLMRSAPQLLRRLLQEEGVTPSPELGDQLKAYYQGLAYLNYSSVYYENPVQPEREAELAELLRDSGLPPALAHLPLALYRRYCAEVDRQYELTGTYRFSEEEIVCRLTCGGLYPLDRYFVVRLYGKPATGWWNDITGGISIFFSEVEVEQEASINYLIARGAVYDSEREVIEKALREGWPHAEEAARAYELKSRNPERYRWDPATRRWIEIQQG